MHTLVKLYRLAKRAKGHEFAQRAVQRLYRARYERDELEVAKYAWREELHPRGQPENKGEFAEVHASIGDAGGKPGEGVVNVKLQHGSTITSPPRQPESDVKLAEDSGDESRWNGPRDEFLAEVKKALDAGEHVPKSALADYKRDTATDEQPKEPNQLSSIETSLKTKSVTNIEKCDKDSANEVSFITLEDGSRGVFKPVSGEKPGMRKDIPAGTYAMRGVAFYEAAKVVGLEDLVPVTVMKTIPGDVGEGSCQEFCESCDVAKKASMDKMYDGMTDSIRAMTLDFVMGNTDRHAGNWMIHHGPKGKLKLIDNDLSLPEAHSEYTVQMMGVPFRTKNVTAHYHNALAHYYESIPLARAKLAWEGKMPEIAKVLKANGISDKAIKLAEKRYEIMMKASTYKEALEELVKIMDKTPHPLD